MSKSRIAKKNRLDRSTAQTRVRVVAVIDMGASSIRMAVAEIRDGGRVHMLDHLIQAVELGRDCFDRRELSSESIEKAVEVLRKYCLVLSEYGITSSDDVRVVATSAVREAGNRLAFIDRVYVATGLNVEVMDEAEVNRITFMGVTPHLQSDETLSTSKVIVIEIGGGSTELLVIQRGNVLHSESFRLGSLRVLESLEVSRVPPGERRSLLTNHVSRTLNRVVEKIRSDTPIQIVALGGDMRFAGRYLLDNWDGGSLAKLPTDKLVSLADTVMRLDEVQVVNRYGASFTEAQTLGPTLLMTSLLTTKFNLSHVYLCDANLRDGLLRDMASRGDWTSEFRDQTVRSAMALGRRFQYDETHAKAVAETTRKLFAELAGEHEMNSRHEVILYVAALLHEIGLFINVQSNHKHSFYIIRNSELFGLSKAEKTLVGLVARYHRRAYPQPSHEVYRNLHRDERIAVAKMAAVLRIAIALNDARTGRIQEIRCVREGKRMVIVVPEVEDLSLERIALQRNAGLYQQVFGSQVMLRSTTGQAR